MPPSRLREGPGVGSGIRPARSQQPRLLVRITQRGGGLDRIGARHRQIEPLAGQNFCDGVHLQPVILAVEERVL